MILGVDPGLKGALALLSVRTSDLAIADMPVIGSDISATLLANILHSYTIEMAVVEKVSSMPGQGVSSVFKFGTGYGKVLGVLGAMKVPITDVTPAQWKREMGLTKDKGRSRELAAKTWPDHAESFKRVKDDGRAEAALLALWYIQRRMEKSAPILPIPTTGSRILRRSRTG